MVLCALCDAAELPFLVGIRYAEVTQLLFIVLCVAINLSLC